MSVTWLWARARFAIGTVVVAAVVVLCLQRASDILIDVRPAARADAAVLLGGDWKHRAPLAAELETRGVAPWILVTGTGDCRMNERELVERGVPAGAVSLECRARSTEENARLSVPLLRARGVRTAVLVTSLFHTRRALASFRHYAPDIDFYTCADSSGFDPRPRTVPALWHTAAELAKTVWYATVYGISPRS